MTITIVGEMVGRDGRVENIDPWGAPLPYQLRPASYLRQQPAQIPILREHREAWTLGSVAHLERSSRGLMMVGRLEDNDDVLGMLEDGGPWYLSDQVKFRWIGSMERGYATISEVSIVRNPANIGIGPIAFARDHDIATTSGGAPFGLSPHLRSAWDHCHERLSSYARQRADRDALVIDDLDPLDPVDEWRSDPVAAKAKARAELAVLETKSRATRAQPVAAGGRVYRRTFGGAQLHLH